MRNIDLDSLRIFKAVVEQGGITKAAAHLHRVQSNITTRVKNLEDRLGVKLFQREGGKLTLSAEGRLLLTYAERLLTLSSEAEAALRSGKPRGTLRIGTMESTAAARLPSVLAAYHAAYPDVRMELVTDTSGALVGKVLNYAVEAAFVAEPFPTAGLDALQAFEEELVLITPKNGPAIKTPKDLERYSVIAFGSGCSYRRILEDWLGETAIVPDRVLELGSYHTIVACVAAGSGMAIVPRSVLRVVNAETELRILPLPPHVARANTKLVWRSGHQSLALEALQQALQELNGKPQGIVRKRAA